MNAAFVKIATKNCERLFLQRLREELLHDCFCINSTKTLCMTVVVMNKTKTMQMTAYISKDYTKKMANDCFSQNFDKTLQNDSFSTEYDKNFNRNGISCCILDNRKSNICLLMSIILDLGTKV